MYRIGEEEIVEISKVIENKQLFRVGNPEAGHLQEVDRFEKEWAEKIGTQYALCVSGGGTAALICGLVGLGIGPGDEVIVPGYTFMASALAVLAVGAIPVIAEIDDSLTIEPQDIERKTGPYTKAIMPVHIAGFPCAMEKINAFAEKHNLKILEDCCQADGGSYQGKRLGTWGDAGAFSFNDFKILSCGEGGAMVTDDRKTYERALVYHDGGATFRPYAQELTISTFTGMQLRASEIMGAILRIQLQRLEGILSDLRRIKKEFIARLAGITNIKFVRSNDTEGDCGTTAGFLFETETAARAFAAGPGVNGLLPIDSNKHVYSNWKPVLEKQGSHHPALNPFNLPQNKGRQMDYSRDMCPKTLDILSRTVFVLLSPDWTQDEVDRRIEACQGAAEGI